MKGEDPFPPGAAGIPRSCKEAQNKADPLGVKDRLKFLGNSITQELQKGSGGLWDQESQEFSYLQCFWGSLSREIVLFPQGHLKTSSHHHASGSHAAR